MSMTCLAVCCFDLTEENVKYPQIAKQMKSKMTQTILKAFKRTFVEPVRKRRLMPSLEQGTPILIYQMGKVASTSIFRSLEARHEGWVIQLHEYEPEEYTTRKLKRRMVFDHALKYGKRVNVITLTREPIGRNVACLFENFVQWTGRSWGDPDIMLSVLEDYFLNEFDHDFPLRWFDDNIKAHFGIDCYSKPIADTGFQTFEEGPVRLLVLHCELPDVEKCRQIEAFLGISDFELQSANVGSKKPYADLYRDFKEQVRLPEAYIDKMCNSRYFTHFYSADVVESVRKRWSAGSGSDG